MNILHNVNLKDYCTLKVGGTAAHFAHITTRDELTDACQWAKDNEVGVFVLGEGSNLVFSDNHLNVLVLRIEIPGFETVEEDDMSTTIKVGAGEHWDGVVEQTVEMGLSGLESLSMIPGTAGATPVQNVGAYGHEVSETITEIEVYDLGRGTFETLANNQCGFGYRNSIFKTSARGKYVICSVTFKLLKDTKSSAVYESLTRWLKDNNISQPTISEVRKAVVSLRAERLPDPSVIPNVGSFFGNPIVDAQVAKQLQSNYSYVPVYPARHDGKVKLAAGWLIEHSGLKGKTISNITVYDKHAQVLTNPNGASYQDLVKAKDEIIKAVQAKFGVTLEPEPQFIE